MHSETALKCAWQDSDSYTSIITFSTEISFKLKMTILQINTVGNSGSTGRIAEQIGIEAIRNGWDSHIACAIRISRSRSNIVRVGSPWHRYPNVLWTRIFDSDSPLAKISTLKFVENIKRISPDIIHLHNLHGYYLHAPTLLKFLGEYGRPVVWTLHDCWPMTGHCAYFDFCGCEKWKSACAECPQKREYPASWIFDRSAKNHSEKIELISKIKNLTLVPVSNWIGETAKKSKLKFRHLQVIRNGINLEIFRPSKTEILSSPKTVLFVANKWEKRKGFDFIPEISAALGKDFECLVVGVDGKQEKYLRERGMRAMGKLENAQRLSQMYSSASVFANPTMQDNYPTVNLEAAACGTPVVTFDSGGTPETIPNPGAGSVVARGDVSTMVSEIKKFAALDKSEISKICRKTAEENFDAKAAFGKYCELYRSLVP